MKFIFRFFAVLGVIFFCLLLGLGYFIVADPYNLRPLISGMFQNSTMENEQITPSDLGDSQKETTNGESAAITSKMSTSQAQALESVGIDVRNVPTEFTPEQTTCFVGILGEARVEAIKAGDTPTATEFFQAKACL